ncbi:MAG: hypothetical protein K0R61_2537 [Microvirga sp.]|nr:hypothetical protein [Microvirga sp.]MDF2972087.1 hypothetical protein [Microvirga sp.]
MPCAASVPGPKIVVNQPHPAIRMVQRDERAELITMGARHRHGGRPNDLR